MNPVVEAQLKDFAQSGNYAEFELSELFELYSIYSICNGALGENLDPEDLHLSGSEFGLDGVGVVIQGELVDDEILASERMSDIRSPSVDFLFFQSKMSESFDYGEISKFFDSVQDFFDFQVDKESEQLQCRADAAQVAVSSAKLKTNPTISCYFVTTGNYQFPKRIEKLIDSFNTKLEELSIFSDIKITMVGARDLQKMYRSASSAAEVKIRFDSNVVLPKNENVQEGYIGYLPAQEIINLCALKDDDENITSINKSIFFDNIRDFDPQTKINKEIIYSISEGGNDGFVYRNNGVTVVAKELVRTANEFRIQDFQIVNGCQTCNIIFECRDSIENIYIPFRLIVSKDDDFVSSIIVGTNRQNPVKEEQFLALRNFMKNFEEFCRSPIKGEPLYFERRENQYRGKEIERVRIFKLSVFIKNVTAAILHFPNRAARDYKKIASEYDGKIFLDNHDVKIYYCVCYINYKLEFIWRNRSLDSDGKIYRYYIMFSIGFHYSNQMSVLNSNKRNVNYFHDRIIEFCNNEEKMVSVCTEIISILKKLTNKHTNDGREKIRDLIRSETFANNYKEQLIKCRAELFSD